MSDRARPRLLVHEDPPVAARLEELAATARLVFFAGLPGTGKSLLIHQCAHLAHAGGREVSLLQWDVVRPLFEASPRGVRYPTVSGVTHGVIRKAVGLWAREALVTWHHQHPEARHLLIGETPLVGGRFIELGRHAEDAAEPLLAAPTCRFVIPVPSAEVRRFLEHERSRRITRPRHDREREDAPPNVLHALWTQVVDAGRALGLASSGAALPSPPYDPALYERVYRSVLRHRHVEPLAIGRILSGPLSVYAFDVPTYEVVPAAEDPDRLILAVENRYHDRHALDDEIDRWYLV